MELPTNLHTAEIEIFQEIMKRRLLTILFFKPASTKKAPQMLEAFGVP